MGLSRVLHHLVGQSDGWAIDEGALFVSSFQEKREQLAFAFHVNRTPPHESETVLLEDVVCIFNNLQVSRTRKVRIRVVSIDHGATQQNFNWAPQWFLSVEIGSANCNYIVVDLYQEQAALQPEADCTGSGVSSSISLHQHYGCPLKGQLYNSG